MNEMVQAFWEGDDPGLELAVLITLAFAFVIIERFRPSRAHMDWKIDFVQDALIFAALAMLRGPLRQIYTSTLEAIGVRDIAIVTAARTLPDPVRILLAIVVADFLLYWIHRAMHAWPLMWRTHVCHHSTVNLNWFSGFRASIPHTILFALPQAIGGFILLELGTVQAGIAYSIGVFFQLFAHANFDVKLGFFEKVVTTPQYHRVHHAVDMKLGNMNLAVVLPIWDILFGTYVDPRSVPAHFPLGLEKPAHPVKAFVGIG